jgi:hypothetical protein
MKLCEMREIARRAIMMSDFGLREIFLLETRGIAIVLEKSNGDSNSTNEELNCS